MQAQSSLRTIGFSPIWDAIAIQSAPQTFIALTIALAHPACLNSRRHRTTGRAIQRTGHNLIIPGNCACPSSPQAIATISASAAVLVIQELDGVVSSSSTVPRHFLIGSQKICMIYDDPIVLKCIIMVLKSNSLPDVIPYARTLCQEEPSTIVFDQIRGTLVGDFDPCVVLQTCERRRLKNRFGAWTYYCPGKR